MGLVFTMLAALVLGCGVPPTAVYVIMASLTVPTLVSFGLLPLSAHFFVFYFGCIAAITPPVALASYAAAGISGASPVETGFVAFRFGLILRRPLHFRVQPRSPRGGKLAGGPSGGGHRDRGSGVLQRRRPGLSGRLA